MTAAVLYGSENLKIESVDIPRLAADEALIRVQGRADLRHGFESLEAGISRAHDSRRPRFSGTSLPASWKRRARL